MARRLAVTWVFNAVAPLVLSVFLGRPGDYAR